MRAVRDPAQLRAALLGVPPAERDAWVDRVLDLDPPGALADDERALPRGCVPYLPCPVDALLRTVEHARVTDADVFVDVGAGAGRAALLVHLLTGAPAIGIEIQPALVRAARHAASRLALDRVRFVHGDATDLTRFAASGTVFFLYCPFSGERLAKLIDDLEPLARTRPIRICAVDVPLPDRDWLEPALTPPGAGDLTIRRSQAPVRLPALNTR